MTGATVAVGLGLRAPFMFAAGVYGLAALVVMAAVSNRQPEQAKLP